MLFDAIEKVKGMLDVVVTADVKRELLAVLDEALAVSIRNRELEAANHALEEKLQFKGRLAFKDNALWAEGESSPYCNGCWEGSGKAVHLTSSGDPGFYRCPVCENTSKTNPRPTPWRTPGGPG